MENVRNWGDAMFASLVGALQTIGNALPRIVGFILILIAGWLIASLIAGAIAALLRRVRFNELATSSGFSGFVSQMGVKTDAAGFIAEVTKWFIRLIALVVAFDALGLPAVSDVLRQLLLFLPNLVVGIVVLVIGGIAANAFSRLVRGATAQAGLGNPDFLAGVARVAVWAFAIVVAVNQIGVATTLVNTLFMAVVGALALALGLAFGLGGRETAAEIVRNWYQRGRAAAPQLQRAAEIADEQARLSEQSRGPGGDGRRTPPFRSH